MDKKLFIARLQLAIGIVVCAAPILFLLTRLSVVTAYAASMFYASIGFAIVAPCIFGQIIIEHHRTGYIRILSLLGCLTVVIIIISAFQGWSEAISSYLSIDIFVFALIALILGFLDEKTEKQQN